jgi:hypothetical protein
MFKQWWSAFSPISTKLTTTHHFKPLRKKKTTKYGLGLHAKGSDVPQSL